MRFNGDCDTVFLPNILKTIVSNYSSKAGIAPKHPQYVVEKHVKGVWSLLNIHPLVLPEHCRNAEKVCCFTCERSTCRFSNSSPDISHGTRCIEYGDLDTQLSFTVIDFWVVYWFSPFVQEMPLQGS